MNTEQLLPIRDLCPSIIEEIRYFTSYNFMGCRVDGYEAPTALLTRPAAEALAKAAVSLLPYDMTFRVFDAYRPQQAVDHFLRWAQNPEDQKMKPYFYPEVDKPELIPGGYIAPRSGHSRGSTVDLTLFDMKHGRDLDMGSPFDYFGTCSHFSYDGISSEQKGNRYLLRKIMEKAGFVPYEYEWWHFTLKDEPFPDTYFDLPIRP